MARPDGLGNLTAVTNAFGDPDQTITSYQYDERGNLTQTTDAQSTDAQPRQTKFEYDTFGRKVKRTLPGGKYETFQYYDDNVGNLWTHTDFNLKPTVFEYDSENRLLKKTPDSSFGAVAIQFTYTPDGQRESMTDASGPTKYEYLDGRLWKKITPYGTLTYTHDENGNVTGVTSSNPNGMSLSYQWDPLNRLSTVMDNRAGGTTTYLFDQSGRLQEMDYPSSVGVKHVYTYDEMDRLTGLSVSKGTTTLGSFAYTLGPVGNRTQVAETLNTSARSVAYGYDRLYRLTNETITGTAPTGTIGYDGQPGYGDSAGFDKVGNRWLRASTVSGVSPATYSYDSRDRLTTDTYDDNGNTTISGGYTYTYDFENRLLTRSGSPAISMVYDGDGNRVIKTAGATTYYLVDDQNPTGYPQVVEELSAVGPNVVSKVYTYGQRLISQRFANGTVQYYGHDGHGNTRLLLSDQGSVFQAYSYDAFGILISPSSPPAGNDYLYCGEQLDRDLGLYYLRARLLNPATGRFLTADSLEGEGVHPPSLHRYLYGEGSRVDNDDPTGMYTQQFGYDAEMAIQTIYQTDHSGDFVLKGVWTRLGSPLGLAYRLKPDIFNVSKKRWADVKPLSEEGVMDAAFTYSLYQMAFKRFQYKPDAKWKPSTHRTYAGTVPIVFFNAGGIIFYTDETDFFDTLDIQIIGSAAAAKWAHERYLARTSGRTLLPSLARINRLAVTAKQADTTRLEVQEADAALLTTMGDP